jgi:hypothetical protein
VAQFEARAAAADRDRYSPRPAQRARLALERSRVYGQYALSRLERIRADAGFRDRIAQASLRAGGRAIERLLVTPTAFNTLLWRGVAVTPDGYLEGFRSMLDHEPRMTFDVYPRGEAL